MAGHSTKTGSGKKSGKITRVKSAVQKGKKIRKIAAGVLPVLNVVSLLVLKWLMRDKEA